MLTKDDLDELVEKKQPRRSDMADVVAEVRRLFEALIAAEEHHREDMSHVSDAEADALCTAVKERLKARLGAEIRA